MNIWKICLNCDAAFLVTPGRDWREHCCSSACKKSYAARKLAAVLKKRERDCAHCATNFVPRQTQLDAGAGKFCSVQCGLAFNRDLFNSDENKSRRTEGLRKAIADGRITYISGPGNRDWTGGRVAALERAKPIAAARNKAYRKANPHKVKEYSQRRRNGMTGRLPRGTVAKLLELQRGKCTICKASIAGGYHIDHINPLARGGTHEPSNIQLLCPTCNVRKSAKDPIVYMQSRGFLL